MQAILTKYIPATNCKPSRIKAWCERGSITIEYPHGASGGVEGAHTVAAKRLQAKFEDQMRHGNDEAGNVWASPMICGGLPNNTGFCFVFAPSK